MCVLPQALAFILVEIDVVHVRVILRAIMTYSSDKQFLHDVGVIIFKLVQVE